MLTDTGWSEILPGLFRFRDSCNVYGVVGPEGIAIVNAGTGRWLERLDDLPADPVVLLCTHFFRDHTAGAAPAAAKGLQVYVPELERSLIAEPELHFIRRETYNLYHHYWDHFAPIRGTRVAGVLLDYEIREFVGLEIETVPLPGVTVGQVGLALKLPSTGDYVVFCGEAIQSKGRLARVAPLQYGLYDVDGALGAWTSARRLRRMRFDALFPSLGEPILSGIDGALEALESSLERLTGGRYYGLGAVRTQELIEIADADRLLQVSEHVFQSMAGFAASTFLVSASDGILAIDYGFELLSSVLSQHAVPRPERRRALLHSLDALEQATGSKRIDVVLVTHYHDDHVAGIPVLQRLFGTECWCPDNFADLIERPHEVALTAVWSSPLRVDRRLPLDEAVDFGEYELHIGPNLGGHTRFSSLIRFEADGIRYAHTGDEIYWASFYTRQQFCDEWIDDQLWHQEMFRSGPLVDGYLRTAELLREWRPDVVLSGHQPPMYTDLAFFDRIEECAHEFRSVYEAVIPLGREDVHFELDACGGQIRPYRTHLAEPGRFVVTAIVRNPLPRQATLEVRVVVPPEWKGTVAAVEAGPRAEVSCQLEVVATRVCRRRPFAIELIADGETFGEVAEALVTVGGSMF